MRLPRRWIGGLFYLVLVSPGFGAAAAAEEDAIQMELPSGQEIEVQRFAAAGGSRLLWLPSERGFNQAHQAHARALARLGHEVWLADLHDAYFVERNRRSIGKFPVDDIVAIIEAASAGSAADVYLLSSSRGAQLALIAAREWQRRNPGRNRLKGVYLAHAYLYQSRPEAGQEASYLPIVAATNLPIYLLDAQYSTRSLRIQELASALGAGGSQVFTQVIRSVQGGFFARDDNELGPRDMAAKRNYAGTIDRALKALALAAAPEMAVESDTDTRVFSQFGRSGIELTPLANPFTAPALRLKGYDDNIYALERQHGKVVLINFWASWCKPCVDEIPSLHRLRDRVQDPAFDIVTVNVGEGRERIAKFLQRVPIELPLLLDVDSSAASAWKIYVYPSSYLVDHRGHVRYAYLGALEWDSPENIAIVQRLLKQR
ncbi:MAG: TlpA family protein disulfide reductase [Gammaproteobacteria bacterium]|nr:TlpA family protein disulfide reductase [Gammaproteobacteria bacterium]